MARLVLLCSLAAKTDERNKHSTQHACKLRVAKPSQVRSFSRRLSKCFDGKKQLMAWSARVHLWLEDVRATAQALSLAGQTRSFRKLPLH